MRTKVFFYNRGNITIKNKHIERLDPLRVVLPDDNHILDVKALDFPNKKFIKFCPKLEEGRPTEVMCEFKRLEKKELAVIEILHTGADRMEIKGKVRDMPDGILDLTTSNRRTNVPMSASEFILWILVAVVLALGLQASPIDWKFMGAGVAISSIQPMILHWRRRRRISHRHRTLSDV
jgi:hypothetical protein